MPFSPQHSLLRAEVSAFHHVDTSSVEALFGMWSLFSKASHAMEDGKRLENLSWRLWNRETFCCAPKSQSQSQSQTRHARHTCTANSKTAAARGDLAVPALSSSLDSASSDEEFDPDSTSSTITAPRIPKARPELRRNESTESSHSRGREKHITPIDLQKMVISIKETKQLEPIELPMSTPASRALDPPPTSASQGLSKFDLDDSHSQSATSHPSESQATLLESSASTVGTNGSHDSKNSQTVGSQESSSTEMSTHSIVRGFAPSSYRSQTNLTTQPTPILKTSPQYRPVPPKKKGPMFTIGTSSGEDESSLESHMYRSQLSESLRKSGVLYNNSEGKKKQTTFKDEISERKAASEHSPVFESDDEDEDVSESAIDDDDDDSSDWEDSDDQSGPSSVVSKDLFQRVDSRPNLTSRRSLLTSLMHQGDRAKALQNAASRSTPAIRRSRNSTPNGPSVATSPEQFSPLHTAAQDIPRSRPILTTTNTHQQPPLSPRTTRRNMLSTELTESLRKNLLWERQQKSSSNVAALKRRHTSTDVKSLKQHPEPAPIISHKDNNIKKFTNDYFSAGLGEYHARGW